MSNPQTEKENRYYNKFSRSVLKAGKEVLVSGDANVPSRYLRENEAILSNNAGALIEFVKEARRGAPLRKRFEWWCREVLAKLFKFLHLDASRLEGFPMTRRKYQQWEKSGEVQYFKCDGYEVCSQLDGLSPHVPIRDGWMVCQRESGSSFRCGVTTRAHGYFPG